MLSQELGYGSFEPGIIREDAGLWPVALQEIASCPSARHLKCRHRGDQFFLPRQPRQHTGQCRVGGSRETCDRWGKRRFAASALDYPVLGIRYQTTTLRPDSQFTCGRQAAQSLQGFTRHAAEAIFSDICLLFPVRSEEDIQTRFRHFTHDGRTKAGASRASPCQSVQGLTTWSRSGPLW